MARFQPILALLLIALALVSASIENRCPGRRDCPQSITAMAISSEGQLVVASEESIIVDPNPSPYRSSFLYASRDFSNWALLTDRGDELPITSLAAHPKGPIVATGNPKFATQAGIHYSKDIETDAFRGIAISSAGSYYNARVVGKSEDMIAMFSTARSDATAAARSNDVSTYPYISLSHGRNGIYFGHVRLADDSSLGYPLDATYPTKDRWYLTRAPYSAPGLKPTANGGIWRSDSAGQKWEQVRWTGSSEVVSAMDCFDEDICVFAMQTSKYVVVEGTRNGGGKWVTLLTREKAGEMPVFVRMTSPYAAAVALQPNTTSSDAYLIGCDDVFGHGVWQEGSMGKVSKITAMVPKPGTPSTVLASVVGSDGRTSGIYDFSYVEF